MTFNVRQLFGKWMKYIVIAALLIIVWMLYVQWKIYSVEQQPLPAKSDVGIVLGASLWNDKPSPGLKERLDKAYELYTDGYFSMIIVSGGLDRNGSTLSEAEGMKRYLTDKGIAEQHIILENQATSTYENLLFSQQIMASEGWNEAIIITHSYHGARAKDIANFIGMEHPVVSTMNSQVMWMPWHKARETLAFTKWEMDKLLMIVGIK